MAISKKALERLATGLKRLVPIIQQQRQRDVSEADTVTLVKDILADIFGFDKYAELTSEVAIRGTYCDLGIRLEEKLVELIEVKAVGIELNDRHLKQVVDYAANQGLEWVILTNGVVWQLHHVIFAKPIDSRLVLSVDLTTVDWKKEAQLEQLYPFTREGLTKGAHRELLDRQDATSRFIFAALLTKNDSVIGMIRRELKRIVDVNVGEEEIVRCLELDVIKRDALEGSSAADAAVRVKRAGKKSLRSESKTEAVEKAEPEMPVAVQTLAETISLAPTPAAAEVNS
jgi:hypothetical protein